MNQEGTLFFVVRLPHPWPPRQPCLIYSGKPNNQTIEMWAQANGQISLSIQPSNQSFISQPVDVNSSEPRFVILSIVWTASTVSVRIGQRELLPDAPDVARLVLAPPSLVPSGISLTDPTASALCQTWVQNRKLKFATPRVARSDRRLKTTDEQANDLRACIYRLRHLQQQVVAGNLFLLGTLAGEMRACIYWSKDTRPEANYNPLLLRMANLAELPLPVYQIPKSESFPSIPSLQIHYEPGAYAPRIITRFATDQICDLQESLASTVLQLDHLPGRTITTLSLIKELANTMGASHYDEDASDFLEVLQGMRTSQGDHVMILMCQTADAIAALSDWVLSELKKRNIIG
jgi:hypothetical protein